MRRLPLAVALFPFCMFRFVLFSIVVVVAIAAGRRRLWRRCYKLQSDSFLSVLPLLLLLRLAFLQRIAENINFDVCVAIVVVVCTLTWHNRCICAAAVVVVLFL